MIITPLRIEILLGRNKYKIEEYEFNPNNYLEYINFLVQRQQTIIRNNANERHQIYDELHCNEGEIGWGYIPMSVG